ncbi:putative adhesion G protein-coupled receptor E4P [Aplochiton taeniatus]
MVGDCINTEGSYKCRCHQGYSNYGNELLPCSELSCDFEAEDKSAQSLPGLSGIMSLIKDSCLALSDPDSSGGQIHGETLLETLFTATDKILSPSDLGNRDVSGLLGAVEDAMRLIGPQLTKNETRMETEHTEANLAIRRGKTPPTGLLSLTNENASLDIRWETATTKGQYPGYTSAALVTYKTLESSDSVNASGSFQNLTASREPGSETRSYQVFSKVVSAVVSNPSTQNLESPVTLTFRHLQVDKLLEREANYTCVYWTAGSEGHGGMWSTHGCTLDWSNSTHTVCVCSHLSSFAVLMSLYPRKDPYELVLLTRLGLSISLVCLAGCILTFHFCRSIQGTRTTIHLHVSVCLFMGDLVFLAGISSTEPKAGCTLVAVLLHFFFLGAFSWMLLEGVQLYRMVVLVFNTTMQPLPLYGVGYGLPIVIVAISGLSRPSLYGTEHHCWLSLEKGLIWSFFGPVVFVILLNIFFFIITVWKLAQKFSSLSPDLSNLRKIKAFTVTAVAQLCVLGLMWIFGAFLFQEEGTEVVAYIFTILNTLQGALMFIMHCLLSKQVREEYSKLLSCVCTAQKKKYSDYSTTNASSSQSQPSRSGQNTGESMI